jgi:hypothetical protein
VTEPTDPMPTGEPTPAIEQTQAVESAALAEPPMPMPPAAQVVPRPGPSGALVAAAVIQLVIAALIGLFGLLFVFLGAVMGQMKDVFSQSGLSAEETRMLVSVGGVVLLVFGGIALAVALAHLLSGIGVLKRWGWARILGIVMSVLGVLIWLLILVSNLVAATQRIPASYLSDSGLTVEEYRRVVGASAVAGVVIAAIALGAYTFVLVVLIRRGSEFS